MWRISSSDGSRWVQWNGPGDFDAQPVELFGRLCDDQPVEIAAMSGEFYTPTGPDDVVALFLRAQAGVGGGMTVTGRPPTVPLARGGGCFPPQASTRAH